MATRDEIESDLRLTFIAGLRERILAHLDETRQEREEQLYWQLQEQWTDEFEEGLEEAIDAEMECV